MHDANFCDPDTGQARGRRDFRPNSLKGSGIAESWTMGNSTGNKLGRLTWRYLVGTLAIVVLASCADSHKVIRAGGDGTSILTPSDTIYVAVPKDGVYGEHVYSGSGQTTAQIIQGAFVQHARRVRVGRATQNFDEALKAANDTESDYLAFPRILHWEERATEWSGIPDRVEVNIEIIEVETGDTLTSAVAKGTSGLATFGGDRPQDLLPRPIGKFVTSLY